MGIRGLYFIHCHARSRGEPSLDLRPTFCAGGLSGLDAGDLAHLAKAWGESRRCMYRRPTPAEGSDRAFLHSPKPPYGVPATRLRVSSPARTRSISTSGGATFAVARQMPMEHGRCA